MDETSKKTALRMLPYGLYVLSAGRGEAAVAASVTWVMQTSFDPPLLALGIRTRTRLHEVLQSSGVLALSLLGTGQSEVASTYYRAHEGVGAPGAPGPWETVANGCPVLEAAPAWLEAQVVGALALGDHTTFVARITGAGVRRAAEILTTREAGTTYAG